MDTKDSGATTSTNDTKVPAEEPQTPPTTPTASQDERSSWGSASSWWGWGQNVVMSTVSQVGSTLKDVNDSYVQPTIGTVTKTTSQLVNDIATAIDAPEVDQRPLEGTSTSTSTTEATTTTTTTNTTTATTESTTEDTLFKYIDSSVSLLSAGAGYLTSTVSKGVETIANADIKTVVDSSKQLLDSSVQAANKSLDIIEQGLEKVGSTAMSLLTEEYAGQNRRRPRINLSGDSANESEGKDKKEKDKDTAFEQHGGRKHFENLENLALECLRKQQLLLRKLNAEQSQKVTSVTTSVQELFDREKQDENQASLPTNIPMGESEIAELNSLVAMFTATKEQQKPKSTSVTTEFAEFAKGVKQAEEVAEYITTKQKAIREEGLQAIAKLGSVSVKQLLNVGQSLSSQAGKQSAEQLNALSLSLCQLCDFFDQELTTVSTLFVDAIQNLSLKGGEILATLVASGASAEHVQGIKKQINLKTQAMRNLVYFDVGNAISHIQDSKRLLQNIVKFVIVSNEKVDDV